MSPEPADLSTIPAHKRRVGRRGLVALVVVFVALAVGTIQQGHAGDDAAFRAQGFGDDANLQLVLQQREGDVVRTALEEYVGWLIVGAGLGYLVLATAHDRWTSRAARQPES